MTTASTTRPLSPPTVTGRPPAPPGSSGPTSVDVPTLGTPRSRRELVALGGLLLVAAGLYIWDLSASGWANSFYAAAVQAGTKSWKALLFGSLDAGNAITVDKPPAAMWVMGLSGRIFGFSSWSMLVPEALMGVGSVALLTATVRRWSGPVAGLLAGAALALTPVAALMFRFNNPDALLTLTLITGAYGLTRAIEAAARRAGTLWVTFAGAAIGLGFLTKMGQALLVLPAFALVYLICAPTTLRRRIWQSLAAFAAVIVSAGWYVALVALWPAGSRPYIGGSTTNSLLQLALGYNGLSRLTGGSGGGFGGGGGGGGSSFGGGTGLSRLFSSDMGTEVSWLLPSALIALVLGLWVTRRAPRTDLTRAALLLWGGWLIVTGLVLSFMSGIVHPYYTVALAPSVVALVAVGGRALWLRRSTWVGRGGLGAVTAAAGIWGFVLLSRDASWYPELRYAILVTSVLAALGLLVPAARIGTAAAGGLLTAALVAGMAGPAAYTLATAVTPHTGSVPTAGPSGASSGFGGGGRPGGGAGGFTPPTGATGRGSAAGGFTPPGGSAAGGSTATGSTTTAATGRSGFGQGAGTTSSALSALLKATNTRWAAAVTGSQSAASLELSTGTSVMAIGGFSGSDPSPTLAQFEQYVSSGQVRYYIASDSGGGFRGGSGGTASQIATWVAAHYTATTVGGTTVYDLAATPKA